MNSMTGHRTIRSAKNNLGLRPYVGCGGLGWGGGWGGGGGVGGGGLARRAGPMAFTKLVDGVSDGLECMNGFGLACARVT